jgi:hypothetical protein
MAIAKCLANGQARHNLNQQQRMTPGYPSFPKPHEAHLQENGHSDGQSILFSLNPAPRTDGGAATAPESTDLCTMPGSGISKDN